MNDIQVIINLKNTDTMESTTEARQYCREHIIQYPEHKDEIVGLYDLFMCEIEDDNNSIQNEYELLVSSVEELIEQDNE